MDNSVIVYYSINPPLLDIGYYKQCRILAVVVLVLVVVIAAMLIPIHYQQLKYYYEKYRSELSDANRLDTTLAPSSDQGRTDAY
jgi:hypothetical protein